LPGNRTGGEAWITGESIRYLRSLEVVPLSQVSYRVFSPRDSEEMIDLQRKAYAMPRRAAVWFYEKDEVESLGAFSGDRLVSALDIISFRLRLWDRVWPAGGIAAVATHVEHRKQGHAANLTRLALQRMRERGMLVSVLHPFKRAFYRRYGWEHCVDLLHFAIPLSDLYDLDPKSGDSGVSRFERLRVPAEGPVDMSVPSRIYDACTGRYNCPNARDHEWKALARRLQQRIVEGDNVYAYAGFREDEPVSYAFYTIGPSDGPSVIRVMDGNAADARAWRDLLGFFSLHGEDAGTLDFYAAVDVPVRRIMPEAIRATLQPSLMFRVVDVESFLNGLIVQDGLGRTGEAAREFYLELTDPLCPWNDGVFHASLGEEGSAVRAERCKAGAASVSVDIAAFSQIASGYVTPGQAREMGRLTVRDAAALRALTRIFPGRVTFTADFY